MDLILALIEEYREKKKGEITSVTRALNYLAKWDVLAKTFPPIATLNRITAEQNWDQKKK